MSKPTLKFSRFVRALVLLSFCGHAIAADPVYMFKNYSPGIKGDYALVAGPAALTFDAVIAGQSSSPQPVTVHNIGTSPISFSSVSAGAEFTQTNTCTFLAADATCSVAVSFAPTQTGALTGNLTFAYDNGRALSIPLSGSGVGSLPIATFSTDTVDFGAVPLGSVATLGVQLDNTGQQPLTVSGVTTAGAVFGASHGCTTLEPTENCFANVTFTPAVTDVASGTLEFTTNAPGSPHNIALSGSGATPVVGFTPAAPLTFDSTAVGATSAAQTVTVSNASSGATLDISSIAADAPFNAVATTCTATLAPSANCTVDVAYAPVAAGTGQAGSLHVAGSLSGPGLTYQLTGGQAAYALTGTAVAAVPVISLTDSSWDFGNASLGVLSTAKVITLTNVGYSPMHLGSANFSGANASDFSKSASTCEGAALAHNGSCSVSIAITPTVAGAEAATLVFANYDGLTGNTVSLTAIGQGAIIALSDAGTNSISDISFPLTSAGSNSVAIPVTLTNTGNSTLTFSGSGIATAAPFSQANDCGASVAAGATCTVNLVFSPGAAQGYAGALAVTSNAYGFTPLALTGSGSLVGVAQVSAGTYHTLALKTDGTLWAAGANAAGQLGDGTNNSRSTFAQVQGITGVSDISAGANSTFALKTDGTLWATGANDYGQLGVGNVTNRSTISQVLAGVASVSAGGNHTVAIKTNGTLWATGVNTSGQFGDGTNTSSRSTFAPVSTIAGVVSASAGSIHTFAVKSDGTLWAAGAGGLGRLGDGTNAARLTFTQVLTGVASVSTRSYHALVVKTDGTLWATGYNSSGQIGDGTNTDRSTFAPVSTITGVARVAAGAEYSLALKADGSLWATGLNSSGQLGGGSTRNTFTQVPGMTGTASVSAGAEHALAIKVGSTLWATGLGSLGQLGTGSTANRTSFIQVIPSP
jgi:alpha-tubulin suppressor-like RCC1 family protein